MEHTDPTIDLADRRLMRDVQSGDRQAQEQLMTRLYRRVFRLARYLSRGADEAEDLTHEALMEILDAAGHYRGEGSIEAWADVIAVRRIRRKLKRSKRFSWLLGGEYTEPASPEADPEQQTRRHSRQERLGALLGGLSRDQRIVLVLKLHYGYTAQEVAELTGLSLKAVQYEIKRGRARLRQRVLRDDELRELFPGVTP